jgi:hypothetical protein
MTKQELIEQLQRITRLQSVEGSVYYKEWETSNLVANSLLLDFINDDEVTKAYENVRKD